MQDIVLNILKNVLGQVTKQPSFFMSKMGYHISKKFYDRPIFIVGLGRSGTSILLQSLGQHRQIISSQREVPIYSYIGQIAYQLLSGPQAGHLRYCCRLPISFFLGTLKKSMFEICWGPNFGVSKFMEFLFTNPSDFWFCKYWAARTFPDSNEAIGLKHIYPSSKFIHIFRNGIDVVNSRTKYEAFKTDSFENHCKSWAQSVITYRYLRYSDYALAISHEQLLNKRDETYDEIFKFLELEKDEKPSIFAEETVLIPHDIPRNEEKIKGVDAVSYFSRRPTVHKEWGKDKKEIFKNICSEGMSELGYSIPF